MRQPNIYQCSIVELDKIENNAGNITAVRGSHDLPFDVKRVFYLYDIPGGEARGAHAHKTCHQFLIAASGSFEIVLDDGRNKRTVTLNRPYFGLHVPPGIWAAEQGFSSGSICLTLVSHHYDENDYIRSYKDYLDYICLDMFTNINGGGVIFNILFTKELHFYGAARPEEVTWI